MSAADQVSDEVALDFQESLQDLQNNNRYEISNLTIIAKENTEHAQAIAMVLEKHIKTVRSSNAEISSYFRLLQKELAPPRNNLTDPNTDCPWTQATCTLCTRFYREECWHTIHGLPWKEPLLYLYGLIHSCR